MVIVAIVKGTLVVIAVVIVVAVVIVAIVEGIFVVIAVVV